MYHQKTDDFARDLKMLNKRAFWSGLVHGVAAPALLFSTYSAPVINRIDRVPLLERGGNGSQKDAQKIAGDFKVALARVKEKIE